MPDGSHPPHSGGSPQSRCAPRAWLAVSLVLWAVAVAVAVGALMTYGNRPGELGEPAPTWSLEALGEPATDRPTLVMFVHPKCPCTRASLEQVAKVQAARPHAFDLQFVIFVPTDEVGDWRNSDLIAFALRLAPEGVQFDSGGVLTKDAGARVSGTVAFYSTDGRLQFWGGVTPARGHQGPAAGLEAIRDLIDGNDAASRRAAVFGCPFFEAGESCAEDACHA